MVTTLNMTSKDKGSSMKKLKKELSCGVDQREEIEQKKRKDLKYYIKDLKKLKSGLKDCERRETEG